jgi:hypothetical protein
LSKGFQVQCFIPADFFSQLWFLELNLIGVKLAQEEALVDILLSDHAVPGIALYITS